MTEAIFGKTLFYMYFEILVWRREAVGFMTYTVAGHQGSCHVVHLHINTKLMCLI